MEWIKLVLALIAIAISLWTLIEMIIFGIQTLRKRRLK